MKGMYKARVIRYDIISFLIIQENAVFGLFWNVFVTFLLCDAFEHYPGLDDMLYITDYSAFVISDSNWAVCAKYLILLDGPHYTPDLKLR